MSLPPLTPSQRALILGECAPGSDGAFVRGLAAEQTCAAEFGKRPWHAVGKPGDAHFIVKDWHGNELFKAAPSVAVKAGIAVNEYPRVLGENGFYRDALRAISIRLRTLPPSPAIKQLIELCELSLAPDLDEGEARS